MLKKMTPLAGLSLVGLLVAGCAPADEPKAKPTTTVASVSPSPTPTAIDDAHAFGETVRMEFDGSVWDVTVEKPEDAPARIAEDFPLDQAGTRYVMAKGTVERVEGASVEPITELDVQGVVEGLFVDDEYLGDEEFQSLNAAPQMVQGGKASFAQMFVVPAGSDVKTVVVTLGEGEATIVQVFGEAVDGLSTAAETTAPGGVAPQGMQEMWPLVSDEQRAEWRRDWRLDEGVTDEGVRTLLSQAAEYGWDVDTEADARAFLEWILDQ